MAGPSVVVRFLGDLTGLKKAADDTTDQAGKGFSDFAKKASLAIGGAFAVDKVMDFGKAAVDAASDLNESVSKVGVVFGQQAGAIEKWASTAAKSMGQSKGQALEAAGTYGNLFSALGITGTKAAGMSTKLVGLASDLASFNNVAPEQALDALRSGLTGETEPLKRFGVNMNDATLRAEALRIGLIKSTKDALDPSAKAQAAYSLILAQTTTAQGDFARTSDGLANKQRIAAAQFKDFQATLGQKLLPVLTTLTTFFTNTLLPALERVSGWVSDNKELILAAFVGIAIAVGVSVVPAFIAWAVAAGTAAIATIAAAAPFIALGVVIAAVAFVIIKNWDTIRDATVTAFNVVKGAVMGAFNWIRDNWPTLLAIITGPIGVAVLLITKNWDSIKAGAKAVWDFIRGGWDAIVGFFEGIGKTLERVTKGMWNGITGAFKGAINAIIDIWNRLEFKVPGFKVGPIGYDGFTLGMPDIPHLAQGGLITSSGIVYAHAGEVISPAPATGGVTIENVNISDGADVDLLVSRLRLAVSAGRL